MGRHYSLNEAIMKISAEQRLKEEEEFRRSRETQE